MAYLRHDSGGPATLKNGQVLGDESPMEFDSDGYAGPVDDEDATLIAAMHTHVEAVDSRPESDATPGVEPEESGSQDGDYPTNDEGEPLCTGKADGQCSRTVDDPGGVCWQHEED